MQELPGARLLRLAEDLRGGAALDDHAVGHEDDLGGDLPGELQFVRDDEHRPALARQLAHQREDVADQLGVERRRRLVEEQQVGPEREGPDDADPLLLAAGELERVGAATTAETDALEQRLRLRHHLGRRAALHAQRTLRDVLQDGEVREEIEVLEDHRRAVAERGERALADRPAEVEHRAVRELEDAAVGDLEAVQRAQHRRLARAGRADQRDDLTAADLEVDAAEDLDAAEGLAQPRGAEDGPVAVGGAACGAGGGVNGRHSGPIASRGGSGRWRGRGR